MTVQSTQRTVGPFVGTGSLKTYSFDFKIFSDEDIVAQIVDPSGNLTTLELDVDYTVALSTDQNVSPGGSVTLSYNLAPGSQLTIGSYLDPTQPTQITNAGGFLPRTVEDALDRCTILAQQASATAYGAVRVPELSSIPVLPEVSERKGMLLGFDDNGDPITVAPVDGSADSLAISLALSSGSSTVGWLQSGSGAFARTVQAKLRDMWVTPEDFNATGDGTADDTLPLKNALAASVGRYLRLTPGKTYKIASDELVMPDYTAILGMGATINFTHTVASKRCLAVGNGCLLDMQGGVVQNSSGITGTDGTNQTPVVVGKYTSKTGCRNWVIRNTIIRNASASWDGIAIFGDSCNGLVENIDFGDSATLGIGVLTHWSFDGGPTTPYTGQTTHPHNIVIRNINAGTLSAATALVFVSGSYNIEISNITATLINPGVMVYAYAGDWGYQFGTAVEQSMGMSGIHIKNLYGKCYTGVQIYGRDNGSQAVNKNWNCSIEVDMANLVGLGSGTNVSSRGIEIDNCVSGLNVRRSTFDGFYNGAFLGGVVDTMRFDHVEARNSYGDGFNGSLATGCSNLWWVNCKWTNNNTGSVANASDIRISACDGFYLGGNRFNSSNATWNFRSDTSSGHGHVLDNRVVACSATGPCFSFGASGDVGIVDVFDGNTSDVSPSNGLRGGQNFIPFARHMRFGSSEQVGFYDADGIPGTGTYGQGSVIFNSHPSAGTASGWVKVTAGSGNTLGTDWKVISTL